MPTVIDSVSRRARRAINSGGCRDCRNLLFYGTSEKRTSSVDIVFSKNRVSMRPPDPPLLARGGRYRRRRKAAFSEHTELKVWEIDPSQAIALERVVCCLLSLRMSGASSSTMKL
jgi:hypothetical protein